MKRSGIVIRPLRGSELRVMLGLWKESGLPYRPRGRDSMPSLRAQLRSAPELFLGAFMNKRLIGSVIASDDGRRGWINRLAVRPGFQRKGIAKALIYSAEDALRARGRRLFCVHVEGDNLISMKLLERTGYAKQSDILYYAKRERKSY